MVPKNRQRREVTLRIINAESLVKIIGNIIEEEVSHVR
jgi:hypothetical protein